MQDTVRIGIKKWLATRGYPAVTHMNDELLIESLWQEVRISCDVHENGKPKFACDGTLLDDRGLRSIFDDVDA